ncbi:hypothetical protein TYRP_009518 [Tyrophagus putrescentiae]|nr:hypothetical protein TYRP_009518 [Tyrophagus putrescentiae]
MDTVQRNCRLTMQLKMQPALRQVASFLFLALVQPSVQKNLNAKSALLARGERHPISLSDPGLKEALEAVKSEIFVNCSRLSSFSAVKAEARTDDPIRYWATVLRLDFEEFEEPPKKSRCEVVIDKLLAPKEYYLSSINCTAFSLRLIVLVAITILHPVSSIGKDEDYCLAKLCIVAVLSKAFATLRVTVHLDSHSRSPQARIVLGNVVQGMVTWPVWLETFVHYSVF